MDNILDKFKLSKKDRDTFKKTFFDNLEKQLDTIFDASETVFKDLPYTVLESMSQEDASNFVQSVVKEATAMMTKSSDVMKENLDKVLKDEDKMTELREKFAANFKSDAEIKFPDEVATPHAPLGAGKDMEETKNE